MHGLFAAMLVLAVSPLAIAATYHAHDTLHITPDKNPQAQTELDGLAWSPGKFTVTVHEIGRTGVSLVNDSHDGRDAHPTTEPANDDDYRLVSFPSPRPTGNTQRDTVYLRWYPAHAASGDLNTDPTSAPAPGVLIVHGLEPHMIVATMIAHAMARAGLNAFVIELPGYGRRQAEPWLSTGVELLEHSRQAVDDTRRARDAIAALPQVAKGPIVLQGTSLGGFVAATAASLDGAFKPVLLLLAGANGDDVLRHGRKDAALLDRAMRQEGYTAASLKKLVDQADPLPVAHRLKANQTWLFSARHDHVIPKRDSDALAKAIGLPPGHRIWLDATHYTTLFTLPAVAKKMIGIIQAHQSAN